MNIMPVILFLTGLLFTIQATPQTIRYHAHDIRTILSKKEHKQEQKKFIKGYFTAPDPLIYVKNFISNEPSPIIKDQYLFILAQELAYHVPQKAHQKVIDHLKNHSSSAMQKHPEGNIDIPVFNVRAKAHGTENHWFVQQKQLEFTRLLNNQPINSLKIIKSNISTNDNRLLHGLRKAITQLDQSIVNQLSNYFLAHPEAIKEMDYFTVELATHWKIIELAQAAMTKIPDDSVILLLKKSSEKFNKQQYLSLLLIQPKTLKSRKHVISMMSPYVSDSKSIENYLLKSLQSVTLGQSAAFALSHANINPSYWQKTHQKTENKNVQNNILLALQLNQSQQAKMLLQQLMNETQLDSKQKKWVATHKGGTHDN